MYHTLEEAAKQLGIKKDKLRRLIAGEQLPKRWFGKKMILDDGDISRARKIVSELEVEAVVAIEETVTAYTIEHVAELADVAPDWVLSLAESGKIEAQRLGRGWMVFPGAIEQIKTFPRGTSRRQELAYRTHKGNPKRIPALDGRYITVVQGRFDGKSFAEIAKELGVSRERPSRMFATALRRVALLQQRGITEVERIAHELEISVQLAEKLIEHADKV